MSNLNGLRHTIVFSDSEWEKYTPPVDGYVMLGTIRRGPNHIGALAFKDGRHFCVIEGRCEPLNERRVAVSREYATYA